MKIPKLFQTELENREKEEEKERAEELEKEKKYKQLCKEHYQSEKSLYKPKVEICNKIFVWKKEFLKTEEGAKIFKNNSNSLWVFGGDWAHKLPKYDSDGCWSRIYFKERSVRYSAGYKGVGFMTKAVLNFVKPEDMAKKLNHSYLEKFLEEIDNEKIFENILKLNSFLKF